MTRALLTYEQAAELLNVTVSWVRAERRAGRIPHIVLSERCVRFDADALEAWWQSRLQGPSRTRSALADDLTRRKYSDADDPFA